MIDPSPTFQAGGGRRHPLDEFYAGAACRCHPWSRSKAKRCRAVEDLARNETDMTRPWKLSTGEASTSACSTRAARKANTTEVVLCLEGNENRVEFGAIKFSLRTPSIPPPS